MTVTGLSNGTAYTFEVRAVNAAGAGAASAPATVTPADAAPGQPASPTVEAAGDGGILVRWRAPENRGSAITQYALEPAACGGLDLGSGGQSQRGGQGVSAPEPDGAGRHGL